MKWRTVNSECITCGPFNICRIRVMGRVVFEVWDTRTKKCVARYATAEQAKGWVREQA